MSRAHRNYPRPSIARNPSESGLTLVELLVGITLLSLLSVMAFGGLGFGLRAWESGGKSFDQVAEIGSVQNLVRRVLSQSVSIDAPDANGDPLGLLGDSDSLSLVIMPPLHQADGRFYHLQLVAERDHDTWNLILRKQPVDAYDGKPSTSDRVRIVPLVSGLTAFEISYFGSRDNDDAPAWYPDWSTLREPPRLVRLRAAFNELDGRVWPDLVVRPMIDVED